MTQIIVIIVLVMVACLAWVLWTPGVSKQVLSTDASNQAWHEVLDDMYFSERRHFEERKRIEDDAHKRAASTSG